MSSTYFFGHAESKFQRQFRSPIRSCLNSTRIPKTSLLRARVKLAYSTRAANIIIYNSHHTHSIYILMEIKFSINLRGSACPAAAPVSAHALQDINIRDDFIIGSGSVCVSSRVVHIIYLKFSLQVSRQDIMEAH